MEVVLQMFIGLVGNTLGWLGYIFYLAFVGFIVIGCLFLFLRWVAGLLGWTEVDDSWAVWDSEWPDDD